MQALLSSYKVVDVAPKPSDVVQIDKNDNVLHGLKMLIEGGIVSAPVMDMEKNVCVGLIDVLDILGYTVELFEEVEQKGATIFSRLATGGKFNKTHIGDITDFTHNPYTPLPVTATLYDACVEFVTKNSHRCPIIDSSGKIVSMLTQASLINFIACKPGCLGELGKQTIKDLDLGTKPVMTVPKNMRTIDAFKKMHEARISGIGVVDASNKLIGNLSARDLKAVDPVNIYSSMYVSVNAFLQKIRQDSVQENHPAISCTESTSLEYLIGRLAANRIHRLYVCDKEFHVLRIVSLRDVFKCVMAHIK